MYRKVTITIELDNAAFEINPTWEVARILREYADYIDLKDDVSYIRKLRDMNGNTVGEVNWE